MSFANPLFLLGLLVAGVPLLLHVLKTRNLKTLDFPSLIFLKQVYRQKSFRLRITQILLLLTRMALITTVTLAFAQPYFQSAALSFLNPRPRVHAILLENSASTRASFSKVSLFQRTLETARTLIAGAANEDQLILMSSSPVARVVYEGTVESFDGLERIEPTWDDSDWNHALDVMDERLVGYPGSERTLHIISPFRAVDFTADLASTISTRAQVVLHPIRLPAHENASIRSVTVQPSVVTQAMKVSGSAHITVHVGGDARGSSAVTGSSGAGSLPVQVKFLVDGQLLQTRDLPPGARDESLTFSFQAETPGFHQIEIVLPTDSLSIDNRREAFVEVLPHRRVTLVNGKKRANPTGDEGTYLRRIFGTGSRPVDGFVLHEVLEIPREGDLQGTDLLILANVESITKNQAQMIHGWCSRGGSTVVFLGDQINLEAYNSSFFSGIGSLALNNLVGLRSDWNVSRTGGSVLEALFDSTYFKGITSDQYYLIQTEGVDGLTSPLTFDDGTPALALISRGRGWLVLVNSSANTQTSNLPLFPIFPILMSELARISTDRPVRVHEVGERVVFDLQGDDPEVILQVQGPDGDLHRLEPERTGTGFIVPFDNADRPGVYVFTRKSRNLRESIRFVVVPPLKEFDLASANLDEVVELIPGALLVNDAAGTTRSGKSGLTILDFLLLGAAIFVLSELMLIWSLESLILRGQEPGHS